MGVLKIIVEIVALIAFIGMCLIVLTPIDFNDKNKRNGFWNFAYRGLVARR